MSGNLLPKLTITRFGPTDGFWQTITDVPYGDAIVIPSRDIYPATIVSRYSRCQDEPRVCFPLTNTLIFLVESLPSNFSMAPLKVRYSPTFAYPLSPALKIKPPPIDNVNTSRACALTLRIICLVSRSQTLTSPSD